MKMKKQRKDMTAAEKLRYISMAIEDVVRMKQQNIKPRTSLAGYACQFTCQPKLKQKDFEPMMNMTLAEIIESENLDIILVSKTK